ncbi:MAG: hypothetical protein JWP74_3405 [Marmoricola sp.]|nr:hypothetical protein [Marmoricola sp.]
MAPLLVLVTGSGRSGTSTMSGTLHHLGLFVPGPYLGANESNPKGFFESRWSVGFHNRLIKRAGIGIFDSRPAALEQAHGAVTPRARERLSEFVAEQAATATQVVVKDPRSVWFQDLWQQAAAAHGLQIRYISMLRHPAEVVGSRTTYYAGTSQDGLQERRYAVLAVASWINCALVNERGTRGQTRAFVRYADLLTDWRPVAARLRDVLGLELDSDLAPGSSHPVDDFIDPDLRRHAVTWDELDIPADLQELAQQVWDQLQVLADAGGADAGASAALDELAARYAALLADAEAISQDSRRQAVAAAVLRATEDAQAAALAGDLAGRPVAAVTARDLLREVGRRATRRFRR